MPYSTPNTFTGRWNTDDHYRDVPKTDYVYASYVRHNTALSNQNISDGLTTMTGNIESENNGLAAGVNTVIGHAEWKQNNSLIFFYHNDAADHSIWAVDVSTQQWTKIIEDPILNFQLEQKIFDAVVIDGVLKWTDGWFESFLEDGSGNVQYNPPREIDIQKAIDGDYTAITFQVLDVIKYPPVFGPSCAYATDATQEANRVYGKLWKFRYKYVYDTGAESVWSPVSVVPIPTVSDFISGRNWLDPNADNLIEVTVQTGADIVTQILIAASASDGQYGIIAQLDKAELGIGDNTTYVYDFYNDTPTRPIELGLENYDLVPQVAGSQELVPLRESSAVMSYANFYEGYDKLATDVTIARTLTEIEDVYSLIPVLIYKRVLADPTNTQLYFENDSTPLYSFMENDAITFSFLNGTTQQQVTYVITAADITAINALGTNDLKIEFILTQIGDYCATQLGTTGSLDSATNIYTLNGTYLASLNVTNYSVINRPTNSAPTVKTGIRYELGIQYYDRALRDGTVIPIGDYYVPSMAEENTSLFTNPNNPYTVALRVSIDHDPPDWARYFQIVVKDIALNFQQRSVTRLQAEGVNRIKLSLERFYIDRYGVINNNGLAGGAQINYTPQKGDIVRFTRKAIPTPGQPDPAPYCSTFVELEVLAYSPTEGEDGSECIWVSNFDWATLLGDVDSYGGFVIEIMNPIQTVDVGVTGNISPWREVGQWFDVLNPYTATRSHAGNVQNQVNGGVPAISTLSYWNCYLRPRHMGSYYNEDDHTNAVWWIEDPYYSDYYDSDVIPIGRLAIEDLKAKRRLFEADIRHSKTFVQGSNINGLCTFTFEDRASLSEADGEITRLIMAGDVLKVLQPWQETSIYIQQAYSITPDGTGNTAFTDKVFGGIRRMSSNYGLKFRGAVCKVERDIYYFDFNNGAFIRSTPGGQVNISDGDYKFRRQSDIIRSTIDGYLQSDIPQEFFAFPIKLYDEIQFWFGSIDPEAGYSSIGYVFNFGRQTWECTMALTFARYGCAMGESSYSTLGDILYYESASGTDLTFYDVPPDDIVASIQYIENESPLQVKVPLNVFLNTNSVLNGVSVEAFTNSYASPQGYSETPSGGWAQKEGGYVIPVRKNQLDPNFDDQTLAAVSGQNLRGNWFKVTLNTIASEAPIKTFFNSAQTNLIISPPIP